MYWLSRPPYRRWISAGLIVMGALYLDLAGPPTESYPFVAEATAAGEAPAAVWRQIPTGLLPPPADMGNVSSRPLPAGAPLFSGLLDAPSVAPADWWAIETPLPARAAAGEAVLVVVREPGLEVDGIVVVPAARGSFGGVEPGLIAVPEAHASVVAAALAENRASLLIKP